MEWDKIVVDENYISLEADIGYNVSKNVPIVHLVNEISRLIDAGFLIDCSWSYIVLQINISGLNSVLKNEWLEKSFMLDKGYSPEFKKRISEFAENGCQIKIKNDEKKGMCLKLTHHMIGYNGIKFGENYMQIGEKMIENINYMILDIRIDDENYKIFDIENLSEVDVRYTTLYCCDEKIDDFMKQYKGYSSDVYSLSTGCIADCSYRYGSMIATGMNPNCRSRMNLFILMCTKMYYKHDLHENKTDLLMNPIVLIKLATYITEK